MADYGRRKTPPETEDEHAYMWEAADKAHKSWKITGPFHAAVTNWKGWVTIVAIFGVVNSNKILTAIIEFLEKMK